MTTIDALTIVTCAAGIIACVRLLQLRWVAWGKRKQFVISESDYD
jgi:hypothetical protein